MGAKAWQALGQACNVGVTECLRVLCIWVCGVGMSGEGCGGESETSLGPRVERWKELRIVRMSSQSVALVCCM